MKKQIILGVACANLFCVEDLAWAQSPLIEQGVTANKQQLEALEARIQNLEAQFNDWDTVPSVGLASGVTNEMLHRLGAKIYSPVYKGGPIPGGNIGPTIEFTDNAHGFGADSVEIVSAAYRPILDDTGTWWLDFSITLEAIKDEGIAFTGGNVRLHHVGGDDAMPWLERIQLIEGFIVDTDGNIQRPSGWSYTRLHNTNRAFAMLYPSTVVARRVLMRGTIQLTKKPSWVVY